MKLQVESLSWGIRGHDIVRDVSLSAGNGEFVGIIGPNGSGKSSLLRCIYRMNRPARGRVLLDGIDIWGMRPKEFAVRAAAVPQEMPAQFDFSVREMASMGRYPHKRTLDGDTSADRSLVDSALTYVGMLDKSERMFSSLSGGEKQRTLIARAIAQDTGLMLLDEPTNHLDIYYQLEIMNLLKNTGVSCLVVMHDLNLAAQYCDKIYVMKDGRIEAHGSPHDVLTAELIRRVYRVEAKVLTETERPQIIFCIHNS